MSETKENPDIQQESDRKQLFQLITGHWIVQAIAVAAELGIADLLASGSKTIQQLAESVVADEDALERLLRFLVNADILLEDENGHFSSSRLGDYLRRDHPQSFRALAILEGREFYHAWGELLHSVKTGNRGFDKVYGTSLFEYLTAHPESKDPMYEWMSMLYGLESPIIVAAYDFLPFSTIVDVGGAEGDLLSEVLHRHPQAQGVLFDLPIVVEGAARNFVKTGLEARCRVVSGNFFEAVPEGGDLYLLRHIIHDWNDEQAGVILKNCRQVMSDTARLLIMDTVIPTGNERSLGKFLDLNMLVIAGGRERTHNQFEDLLNDSGFKLTRIVSTTLPRLSIVEAKPV